MSKEAYKQLKPFNGVVQVCPICGKVGVYKGDNHTCESRWRVFDTT